MIAEVVLIGLAAWRSAHLLTQESGPGNVFGRIRDLVGAGPGVIIPNGSIGELFSCVWCASVYFVVAFWLCWEYASPLPVGLLAAAGISAIIQQWNDSGPR